MSADETPAPQGFCKILLISTFRLGLLFAFLSLPGLADAELVLVEGGQSLAPIVVFENAPPKTRRAADELADYLERISGARPEVIEGRPDPLFERAIWVGYQPTLDDLFPNLDFDFQNPEEILIAANEAHLVIAGRDRWDPDHLEMPFGHRMINGVQQEYGTANAVYTFLQDYLDVRWLWPGELGEDIVEKDTIAFAPFVYRYHPQFRGRSDMFRMSSLGQRPGRGHSHAWLRFQRMQLDSLSFPGGHPFAGWWDRFHEDQPEYFALQPDGERSGFPNHRTVKLCKSNPAVWDQWLKDVEAERERDPNQVVFGANPNDSANSGYCVCHDCLAWDHPEAERVRYTWKGSSQEYVAMSDRQITFANTLARRLESRFPGEGLLVSAMGYGGASLPAPVGVKPDDNVMVSLVLNDLRDQTQREKFRQWAAVTQHLAWRPNIKGSAVQAMPGVRLADAVAELRFVAENRCIAIFIDTIWEHWGASGPLYYVLAQMAWNPWQDEEALLEDYYRRGFGKAADAMKTFWEFNQETESTLLAGGNLSVVPGRITVFDPAFFDKAFEFLDRAELAVDGEPEPFAKRINFVRMGLRYSQLLLDFYAQKDQYRKSENTDEAAWRKINANWKEMAFLANAHASLINWVYLRPAPRWITEFDL